jgi:5-oxoprolinase (ATP-hydrolysing) subunit A
MFLANIPFMDFVVDINCDMGESFGTYKIGNDEEVIKYITSSNIACGFHASDPNVMKETVTLCKKHDVMVGAHPGYPDLLGFGRRFMDIGQDDFVSYVLYQVGALKGFLDYFGMPLQYVKLHGVPYNYLVNEEKPFLNIVTNLRKAFGDIRFLTLGTKKTGELKERCKKEGIRLVLEAFPDRMYTDEGGLLPREYKEAVLKNPDIIAKRAIKMVRERGIAGVNGRWIEMDIDTMYIHGDNMESIEVAKKIHEYAFEEGIQIKSLNNFM